MQPGCNTNFLFALPAVENGCSMEFLRHGRRIPALVPSLLLFGLLSACVAAPNASYRDVLLTAATPKNTPWRLGSLAKSGSLSIQASPIETAGTAVSTRLFIGSVAGQKSLEISLADPACKGFYEASVEYTVNNTVSEKRHFKLRPKWTEPWAIEIQWQADGAVAVTLNGREAQSFHTDYPPRSLAIEVLAGSLKIDSIDYTNRD
jgi:hypothetical protein